MPAQPDSVDFRLPALLDKLRHLVADQEQTSRREFAGNEAREVRRDGLKETPLHESTL